MEPGVRTAELWAMTKQMTVLARMKARSSAAYVRSPDRRKILVEFVPCHIPTDLYEAIDR